MFCYKDCCNHIQRQSFNHNYLFREFQISLPSGNKILRDIIGRQVSFQIYTPFDDKNNTEGLCGPFDGNWRNDLRVRNTTKLYSFNNLWTDIGPKDYMESWRFVLFDVVVWAWHLSHAISLLSNFLKPLFTVLLNLSVLLSAKFVILTFDRLSQFHNFTLTKRTHFVQNIFHQWVKESRIWPIERSPIEASRGKLIFFSKTSIEFWDKIRKSRRKGSNWLPFGIPGVTIN